MSERGSIFDLGEVEHGRMRPRAVARRAVRAPRPVPMPMPMRTSRGSLVPAVAASLSLVCPGAGQLVHREIEKALCFASAVGFTVALLWAGWTSLDRLIPTLELLGVPLWTAAVAGTWLFALAMATHVTSVLTARAAVGRSRTPHRALAIAASAVVPGWGQVLWGRPVRASLFLSGAWITAGLWWCSRAPSRAAIERLGFGLDDPLIESWRASVLLAAAGVIWALSVWDAAMAGAPSRRR